MNAIGNAAVQECGRWLNNRAENSHQPFRRRERARVKFRDVSEGEIGEAELRELIIAAAGLAELAKDIAAAGR